MELDNRVASSDDEQLVLVDSDDREIGFLSKAEAHLGHGTLHRAFSLFVFNPAGGLLLQQRAKGKRLWPGYWSNGQTLAARIRAVARRCTTRSVAACTRNSA